MMDWIKTALMQGWAAGRPYLLRGALLALTAIVGAVAHRYGFSTTQIVDRVVTQVVEVPTATGPGNPPKYAMGWLDNPDEVARIKATLRHKVFAQTPAGQVASLPDHIYLWDAAIAGLGHHVPARDQRQVGSCTAFGSTCASEYLQCQTIVNALKAGQPPPVFKDLAQETIYGLGRVQVGGGAMGDSLPPRYDGDGATGAWMATASRDYGVVARGTYGQYDLTSYSEATCRQFGNQPGCPAELVAVAKQMPVKAISPVTAVDELRSALASGYPVTVASSIGFGRSGPYVRDASGFLRASGSWPHQMCFIGYKMDERPGFFVMNSWGPDWVSGPSGPGNPPPGGFWCDVSTAQRMLNASDSYAYSGIAGFPAQKLDWTIRQPVPPVTPLQVLRGHLTGRFPTTLSERALAW